MESRRTPWRHRRRGGQRGDGQAGKQAKSVAAVRAWRRPSRWERPAYLREPSSNARGSECPARVGAHRSLLDSSPTAMNPHDLTRLSVALEYADLGAGLYLCGGSDYGTPAGRGRAVAGDLVKLVEGPQAVENAQGCWSAAARACFQPRHAARRAAAPGHGHPGSPGRAAPETEGLLAPAGSCWRPWDCPARAVRAVRGGRNHHRVQQPGRALCWAGASPPQEPPTSNTRTPPIRPRISPLAPS